MSFAPNLHVGLVPEGQNSGAKVVNIVPSCSRRNGKVYPEIVFLHFAPHDVDIDVFYLAANSAVITASPPTKAAIPQAHQIQGAHHP
jgi:hypothetical protein